MFVSKMKGFIFPDTEWLLSSVSDCNILPFACNVVIDFNSYAAIYIFFFKLFNGIRIQCGIRTFFYDPTCKFACF
jgi:hypothetical protein